MSSDYNNTTNPLRQQPHLVAQTTTYSEKTKFNHDVVDNSFAQQSDSAAKDLSGRNAEIVDTRSLWSISEKNLSIFEQITLTICCLWNHILYGEISCLPKVDSTALNEAKNQTTPDGIHSGAQVLGKGTKIGEQLNQNHINLYFQEILPQMMGLTSERKESSYDHLPYIYFNEYVHTGPNHDITIHNKTKEDLIKQLQEAQNTNPAKPIVMPFVISKGLFSEDHIVLVLIKDNIIHYVDSKGPTLDNQKTADDQPFRDVLKAAFPGMGIAENQVVHQECISNCGAYVCKFAQDILSPTQTPKKFGLKEIIEFRQNMFLGFYNFFKSLGTKSPSSGTEELRFRKGGDTGGRDDIHEF